MYATTSHTSRSVGSNDFYPLKTHGVVALHVGLRTVLPNINDGRIRPPDEDDLRTTTPCQQRNIEILSTIHDHCASIQTPFLVIFEAEMEIFSYTTHRPFTSSSFS